MSGRMTIDSSMDDLSFLIAGNIKEIRKRKMLSVEYMAEKMDIDVRNYSRYESESKPNNYRLYTLVKIAKILDVEVIEFLRDPLDLNQKHKIVNIIHKYLLKLLE